MWGVGSWFYGTMVAMSHPFANHRKFWDVLVLIMAGCFALGALAVHTLLSSLLLVLLAVSVSTAPVYRFRHPGRPVPPNLRSYYHLSMTVAIGFLLWCAFWLLVILAFVNSDWQW